MKKPRPKELVARLLSGAVNAISITTSTSDASTWLEKNVHDLGKLHPPDSVGSNYLLFVHDTYDANEVLEYIRSYNEDGHDRDN